MRRPVILLAILFCLAALAARAAHTQATLVLSDDTAKPGDTIWAGVDLKMDPEWHTYWKNSGDAGMPTTISWQLPAGITAGDIQWPLPKKLPPVEVTTYGYEGETMLLVPLTIASNAPSGPITLTANLTWLECKDVCIPVKTSVQAALNIGTETKPSADAATIESWKDKAPGVETTIELGAIWLNSAWWESPATDDTRSLIIDRKYLPQTGAFINYTSADFYPDVSDNFEVLPATKVVIANNTEIRLRKMVKIYSGDWPKQVSGVLFGTSTQSSPRQDLEGIFPIGDQPPASATTSSQKPVATIAAPSYSNSPSQKASVPTSSSLALMLLYAFIGGLILNVMPCVLPVIALKILGFVSEARSEPRRVRNLGFIYALGVLASFSAMAAIVIGIKSAGHQAGWGIQFGNPIFVVCMTTLVTLVALNLFGVFEVTPGGKIMDATGNLASKHGAPGAFFNGLLATLLATPCTAAYLGYAIGFALTQTTSIIILIFLTAGAGLAAPYVLLSCNPALLKFLPKPGAWMEKFKIAMGFPMLATVVWLLGVALGDFGERVVWLAAFLVILAFTGWIYGEFVQRGRKTKGVALALVLILLIGNYCYALQGHLFKAQNLTWEPWTPAAVAEARAKGKPVLVDFTATWCVTCNATVKPALEYPSVVARLEKMNATALLGDYSQTPQVMTDEIAKYGSAGVPLVLVFPKNPNAPAIVLRQPGPFEFASSYAKAVLAALDRAGEEN